MTGRVEIVMPTREVPYAFRKCFDAVTRFWPDAATCFGVGDGQPIPPFVNIWGTVREGFIYRDGQVLREWDHKSAIPTLKNSMIHVLDGDEEITLVVDDPNESQMASIIEAVRVEVAKEFVPCPFNLAEVEEMIFRTLGKQRTPIRG